MHSVAARGVPPCQIGAIRMKTQEVGPGPEKHLFELVQIVALLVEIQVQELRLQPVQEARALEEVGDHAVTEGNRIHRDGL